jgi:hypothetical protein
VFSPFFPLYFCLAMTGKRGELRDFTFVLGFLSIFLGPVRVGVGGLINIFFYLLSSFRFAAANREKREMFLQLRKT